MNWNRDPLDREADELKAFALVKRGLSALGIGAGVIHPKRGNVEQLPEADRQALADVALGARLGAMTGFTGAMMRRCGQDATIQPAAAKREPATLTPYLANMISEEMHARYGRAIGDDFDANYLRAATVNPHRR